MLGAAQTGLVYLHLTFGNASAIPSVVDHRFSGQAGNDTYQETVAQTAFLAPTELLLSPPLKGSRYIAGDGCCDSTRHVRATLAVNGTFFDAQRFAIDWEQVNEQGRIYVGDPTLPDSYIIYGKPVYAVADSRVVAAVDGRKDSPPGSIPEGISLEDADGNHVVLDLGDGRYALYAHLKPNSVKVREGNRVKAGQLLGLVGTSGRSSEPHLHFQITDGSPLASNGLPYLLTYFAASTRVTSTAAFDRAILDGQPIETEHIPGPGTHSVEMPLDLWIVDFPR
jgi:hypothetical protein